jgi:superfamily II DNA or RNA helicase
VIKLRPYQEAAIAAVERERARGIQRTLLVLATGGGKTTIFTDLVRRELEAGGQALVLAHRDELIDQARGRLWEQAGIASDVECGSSSWQGARVVVGSIATLGRAGSSRASGFRPSLVITDEAHHAAADSYMNAYRRFGVFTPGGAFHLGVTATPHRMDNKPMHGSEEAVFETVAFEYGIVDAIRDGYLVDIRAFRVRGQFDLSGVKKVAGDYNQRQLSERVNTTEDNRAAVQHWSEVARDRQTITFCTSVDHAEDMAETFRSQGIKAASVSGAMPKDARQDVIERFRKGETQVLTNCMIATEGFDVPNVGAVLLLRPTMSWSLFAQMVGRGLRLSPGKRDCIVIDVVGAGDSKSLANAPGLLGLPEGYTGEGEELGKVKAKLYGLSSGQQAALAGRQFDLSSIDTVLREVDLLAELKVPDSVQAVSRMAWRPRLGGGWSLGCGSNADKTAQREAFVGVDTLGRVHVRLVEGKVIVRAEVLDVPEMEALAAADRMIVEEWPGATRITNASAEWRGRPASEKQIGLLVNKGMPISRAMGLSMGEATAAIDLLKQNKWRLPKELMQEAGA